MSACATIDEFGIGSYEFRPYETAARCIELVDWNITHKNGAPLGDTKPSWATFTAQTGEVEEVSSGVYQYVLPLLLTVDTAVAWPEGEHLNVYTLQYIIQRSDCVGGMVTCNVRLKLPNVCAGVAPASGETPPLMAFVDSSGNVWSALIGEAFQNIKTIAIGSAPNELLAVFYDAYHGIDRIAYLHLVGGNTPTLSIMDYDGGNAVDLGTPGGTSLDRGAIAAIFPKNHGATVPDIAYWYTQRRGWCPHNGTPTNWATNNFSVDGSMAGFDEVGGNNNLIVNNSGSNPLDRRQYKDGTSAISIADHGTSGGIRTDRLHARIFAMTSAGSLKELNSGLTAISTNAVSGIGSSPYLIGVDADNDWAYFFHIVAAQHLISRAHLDGSGIETVYNVTTALGVTPTVRTGILG